ncbi:MAG TPA: hypothetical protein VG013_02480 [Gemmataceae bacterium]|nr:hypothetical protein [Gemmataceae bacterium]
MSEGSVVGPAGQVPYALAMVICDAIWTDPYTLKHTILGTFSAVSGHRFPLTVPVLGVYIALTDGNGKIPIKLRLIDADEELDSLFESEVEVEFTTPLAVHELKFMAQGITFPAAGEYRVQVTARGEHLVERRILINQIPETPDETPNE